VDGTQRRSCPPPRPVSCLVMSVQQGHAGLAELVLEHGADPNEEVGGETALVLACRSGSLAVARLLLDHGANLNDLQALFVVVQKRDLPLLRELLSRGVWVDVTDPWGRTALLVASQLGFQEVVMLLLQSGAKVDHKDQRGSTPLLVAAEAGKIETVQLLLREGASMWEDTQQAVAQMLSDAGYAKMHITETLNTASKPSPRSVTCRGSCLTEVGFLWQRALGATAEPASLDGGGAWEDAK
jgi:uncharacterized protein